MTKKVSSPLQLTAHLLFAFVICSCSSRPTPQSDHAALEEALADNRTWLAEQALDEIVLKERAALPVLTKALKSREPNARSRAAVGLGRLGPLAREATPYLRDALQDRNLKVVESVIGALQRIGTPDALAILEQDKSKHVGPVIERLKSVSPEVRDAGIRELFEMGPRANYATEPLLALLRDESVRVRTNAELTLLRNGVSQSVIEQAKRTSFTTTNVAPAPQAPKARPFSPNSPTSGYSRITRESDLIANAETVSFEQLKRKLSDFEGLYVNLTRVKFADDPRHLYLPGVGDYSVVPLRDEAGSVIPAKANPASLLIAVPKHLLSEVREKRRAHPDNFFRIRLKLQKSGSYSIATINDFQITE